MISATHALPVSLRPVPLKLKLPGISDTGQVSYNFFGLSLANIDDTDEAYIADIVDTTEVHSGTELI
jgi:hypothetical protein